MPGENAARERGEQAGWKDSQDRNEPKASNAVQQVVATEIDTALHHFDFVQLQKELAEGCVYDAKPRMSMKNAQEFDKCYIGFQTVRHREMKNKLIVFQRYAAGDLQQILSEGIESTDRQLQKAEVIMKKLKGLATSNQKAADLK